MKPGEVYVLAGSPSIWTRSTHRANYFVGRPDLDRETILKPLDNRLMG